MHTKSEQNLPVCAVHLSLASLPLSASALPLGKDSHETTYPTKSVEME